MKLAYKTLLPDSELRAFIYQQAEELESLADNLGDLIFLIEESPRKGQGSQFRVTLKFSPDDMEIVTQGENENVFAALIIAKEDARMNIEALLNGTEFGNDNGLGSALDSEKHLVH